MYILINKDKKECYPCEELTGISKESGLNINTLRSWIKKTHWYENGKYILITEPRIKNNRGGINKGNSKYFNK